MNSNRPADQRPDDAEDDPTGIRELLGSLPDPGPMPPELVARITSSIAAERDRQDRDGELDPVVTPLVRRRPLWQRVGLVAAGLVVVGVAGSSLTGTTPADLATRLTTSSGSADSAASASGAEAGDASEGDLLAKDQVGGSATGTAPRGLRSVGSGDGAAPLAEGDEPTATGTAYTTLALATQARSTLDRWLRGSRELAPPADDDPSGSPLQTADGLRDCLLSLLLSPDVLVGADLGTLDGQDAAMLVVQGSSGMEAYAVRQDCRTGAPGVLAGPVPLP